MEELMCCKTINLDIVCGVADELKKEYDYVLSYFYDAMEDNFHGDILRIIKNSISLLCSRIQIWLKIINELKYDGR